MFIVPLQHLTVTELPRWMDGNCMCRIGKVQSQLKVLSAVKDWFLFIYARRSRTIDVQIEY